MRNKELALKYGSCKPFKMRSFDCKAPPWCVPTKKCHFGWMDRMGERERCVESVGMKSVGESAQKCVARKTKSDDTNCAAQNKYWLNRDIT